MLESVRGRKRRTRRVRLLRRESEGRHNLKPSADASATTEMPGATQPEIRKRIVLISVLLGLMAVSSLLVIVKAVVKRDFSQVAVVLPIGLVAIPMLSTLGRLRRRVTGHVPKLET